MSSVENGLSFSSVGLFSDFLKVQLYKARITFLVDFVKKNV